MTSLFGHISSELNNLYQKPCFKSDNHRYKLSLTDVVCLKFNCLSLYGSMIMTEVLDDVGQRWWYWHMKRFLQIPIFCPVFLQQSAKLRIVYWNLEIHYYNQQHHILLSTATSASWRIMQWKIYNIRDVCTSINQSPLSFPFTLGAPSVWSSAGIDGFKWFHFSIICNVFQNFILTWDKNPIFL